jgi:hypothetical protein
MLNFINADTSLKLVSVSQVDLVPNRAVEPSSTSDVSAVLVGAFVNEHTKPIFHNLIDSFVEPDVVTSHVQIESIVKPFSEDIDDLYELSRTLISLVIKAVVESTIVTSHILSASDVVPVVETSYNQHVNALETGYEISQTDAIMVPQPDIVEDQPADGL